MTVWQIIGVVTTCLVFVLFGFFVGRRGVLRHGYVWKKTRTELQIRPHGDTYLLTAKTGDTENKLGYKIFKEIHYVKKGKEITLYFTEAEVLALLGDAVHVVRCGECKWCLDGCVCVHPDRRNPIGCQPYDYCNEGERR